MTTLSVVIPCYNERNTIEQVVHSVRKAPVAGLEIVVVDDFSTDGTREFLQKLPHGLIDHIVYHSKNRAKGAALRTGFKRAKGDFVVVQDADLEYDPNEYPQLLEPLLADRADVVIGSRFMGGPSAPGGLLLAYG
jgi:glycosyltransferase involved in cell wall biosynthesis